MDVNTKQLKKNAFRVTKERGIAASRVRVPGGRMDAKYLSVLQDIAETYGNGFDVNNYKGKDVVIVAGGTGVSPVRGVMNYFTEHPDECRSLTIINGYKSADDILFKDDYPRYKEKANLILTLDAGEETADHHIGLVTKYIPDLQFEDLSQVAAIVVGPPAMMHFSVMALLQLGLEDHQVWISQERKMCCGLGKCGHCRIGDQYVCLDGPVFNYEKGKHLID